MINEELSFQLSEIESDTAEEIARQTAKLDEATKAIQARLASGKKATKTGQKAVDTAQNALEKLIKDKSARENTAREKAEKQRQAIASVETELLQMFADPELRKRYFAIADMDEIE